jgi:NADH-quinone oxidoreductase subunit N
VSSVVILLAIAILFLTTGGNANLREVGFDRTFEINNFTGVFKALVLSFAVTSLISYHEYSKIAGSEIKLEFIGLILLSTVGSFIAISASSFLVLFVGLELQALSGYALAGFNSSNPKSSEAGLKYFVLGALISCISLFGISFIYGFSGSLQFGSALTSMAVSKGLNAGLAIGIILMLTAVFFKLSAAPMHMWTPDVYEGAPINAVMYFATAQKIAILAVLLNLLASALDYWRPVLSIIKILAILSMIIGSLGALRQYSLKRLMAYSTILNIGYVLIGVVLHSDESIFASILYMVIYAVSTVGFFVCIIALAGNKADEANFDSLKGISYSKKTLAAVISIIMFSMIGLPPLAGFFGKFYLFYQAIKKEEFLLAIIGLTTSLIASYYYLKIVMYMYFIEPEKIEERIPTQFGLMIVTTIVVAFLLFFSAIPTSYLQLIMITP